MEKQISIVIVMDPESIVAEESVLSTVKSIDSHYYGEKDAREYFCAVPEAAADKARDIYSKVEKKLSGTADLKLVTEKDINENVTGEYVFLLKEGAVITSGDIGRMVQEARDNKCLILEPEKNQKEKKPASGYISIYNRYQLLSEDPYNVLIRMSSDLDLAPFVLLDEDARERYMELIIKDEGVFYCKGIQMDYMEAGSGFEVSDADVMITKLMDCSRREKGSVCRYIQNYALKLLLSKMKEHAHVEGLVDYLQDISDEAICHSKDLDAHQALYLLSKKYGKDVRGDLTVTDTGHLYIYNVDVGNINAAIHIRVSISSIRDKKLIMEGMTDLPYLLSPKYRFLASNSSGKNIPIEVSPLRINDETGFDGEKYFEGQQYKVEFPIEKPDDFTFYLQDDSGWTFTLSPRMGAYSRLNSRIQVSYFSLNGYLVKCNQGVIHVSAYTKKLHRQYEWNYMKALIKLKKPASAIYRLLYYIDSFFQKKPVWLVMDRPHLAKDNGEHMFRYLQTTEAAKKNDIYFVLKKSSRDYERLKKVGKVLTHDTIKHRLKFLEAQVLIAAAANNLTVNAFGKRGAYYRDLYNFDFVYLRHGVSHNDQSEWLHRLKKNMRILVATCKPEYEGILQGDYGYTEREVKLTGLSRYDNLYDDRKKIIAILPTWRQNLEGGLEYRSSKRAYIPGFKDTEYFRFYNSLINDERLLSVMKEYGYTGVFYLHPVFEAQFPDFQGNDIITVGNGVADYQQVFKESSLMVTDFSSVAFDFAYLKKPVIYSQFDEDTFYKYHTWGKGYFTYRTDGFGPITNTLDETVETLIDYIKNGCIMKPEYVEKVENFFAYTDRNNCKRIYEAVVEAEKDR